MFQLKNNPKSDYAKNCSKNGEENHGIEFRVYGTRVGFNQSIEDYYIEFNVAVVVGFSFSTKTLGGLSGRGVSPKYLSPSLIPKKNSS